MCLSYTKFEYIVRQVPFLRAMRPLDVLIALKRVGETGGVLVVALVAVPSPVRRCQVHRSYLRGPRSS